MLQGAVLASVSVFTSVWGTPGPGHNSSRQLCLRKVGFFCVEGAWDSWLDRTLWKPEIWPERGQSPSTQPVPRGQGL